MDKYSTKVKLRASIGEPQGSHCQKITPLPRGMTQNVSDAMYQRCRMTFWESFVVDIRKLASLESVAW